MRAVVRQMRLHRFTVVALLTAVIAPTAADARGLRLGFLDGSFATSDGTQWLSRAAADGSDLVRLPTGWGGIAPNRPAQPTNPTDRAYEWGGLDAAIKASVERGLDPLVSFTGAPAWAEGPNKPRSSTNGGWRPDAAAFGLFARAVARRYDGTFPDPASPGATLPKVASFQPWNEPNLATYLAPQWVKRNGRFVTEAPHIYRDLQNAFTAGIHAVQPGATVATAGTAPFGDPNPGGRRIPPVRFWRDVLCLDGKLKRVKGCGHVRFDALAHHPYSVGGPARAALNADDVSVPNLGKLSRVLRAAERAGTAPGKHRLWVTELSWDSKPDDPNGVAERTQARWLAEAFMILWRQGVDTITWYQIRDQPGPNYSATAQSGTYRFNGQPKLSARAFRFPLAIEQRSATRARVWLRAPESGALAIQVRRGGRWTAARTLTARRHAVIEVTVTVNGATAVRATQGPATSLSASV